MHVWECSEEELSASDSVDQADCRPCEEEADHLERPADEEGLSGIVACLDEDCC